MPVVALEVRVADDDRVSKPARAGCALWEAFVEHEEAPIAVREPDANGANGEHPIEPAAAAWTPAARAADGHDQDGIGASPEHLILDTELGPDGRYA